MKIEYTDQTPFPYGKYKGTPLEKVPANYLMWLWNNQKCFGALKDYIKDNLDALQLEIKNQSKID